MGGIDLSKPVTNDILVGDKRNNSVGLWNPDDQVQATNSTGNNGGDSSLTLCAVPAEHYLDRHLRSGSL